MSLWNRTFPLGEKSSSEKEQNPFAVDSQDREEIAVIDLLQQPGWTVLQNKMRDEIASIERRMIHRLIGDERSKAEANRDLGVLYGIQQVLDYPADLAKARMERLPKA